VWRCGCQRVLVSATASANRQHAGTAGVAAPALRHLFYHAAGRREQRVTGVRERVGCIAGSDASARW